MPAANAPTGRLPNASRYDVVRSNLLLAWVAAGVGVELHPRLRFGATFGWGFANIQYTTVSAPLAGESPVLDILAVLSVKDRFVPRVSGSLAAEPIDGLDVIAGFVWIDDILATGDLRLRTFHFATEETINQLNPRFGSSRTDRTFGAQLLAPQASSLNFAARWASRPDIFGTVELVNFGAKTTTLGTPNSVDFVLTARNVHNFMAQGTTDAIFAQFFTVLKPGGTLAVKEHRANPGPQDPKAESGYVTEAFVIEAAQRAGFELVGKSEINANPADTKDHPFGVWTLPPVKQTAPRGQPANPAFDRTKYDAIGESDRMTLRFRKPA